MSRVLDGRAVAATIRADVTTRAGALTARGVTPTLAIVLPTEDESAAWYVRSLQRAADKVGIRCQVSKPAAEAVVGDLDALSAAADVHGVMCQTPLPEGLTLAGVGAHIAVEKDVDGANPESLGRLAAGVADTFAPATAAAVLEILQASDVPLSGRRAVVVGRSTVVGKPAALLLLAQNATVTVCHSRTVDLPAVARTAEILVAAIGRAKMLGAEYVAPGAVVVDVGTNPTSDGGLVGDVDADAIADIAGALTPVPGGVGPVTTALLLRNVVIAAERSSANS
jgi:methylenetetrahydrofolate dehydrogenase (NADP+) / methenyltetrahydrofolate cyclohydrolase